MIDTDKYEGHTPADAWRMADGSAMFMQSANNNADAELMADAPLLLAEVKRLHGLEEALQACVDLLEDIRHGLNSPVSTQLENLYDWHPLIRKVGGHYWCWDDKDECWIKGGVRMIDTDKYEGHTPAPWVALNDNAVKTPKHDDPYAFIERRNDDGDVVALSKADALLIADAPLLLEEVKRLREVNDDLDYELQGFQEAVAEDEAGYKDLVASLEGIEEELKAEVKRLRKRLNQIKNIAKGAIE